MNDIKALQRRLKEEKGYGALAKKIKLFLEETEFYNNFEEAAEFMTKEEYDEHCQFFNEKMNYYICLLDQFKIEKYIKNTLYKLSGTDIVFDLRIVIELDFHQMVKKNECLNEISNDSQNDSLNDPPNEESNEESNDTLNEESNDDTHYKIIKSKNDAYFFVKIVNSLDKDNFYEIQDQVKKIFETFEMKNFNANLVFKYIQKADPELIAKLMTSINNMHFAIHSINTPCESLFIIPEENILNIDISLVVSLASKRNSVEEKKYLTSYLHRRKLLICRSSYDVLLSLCEMTGLPEEIYVTKKLLNHITVVDDLSDDRIVSFPNKMLKSTANCFSYGIVNRYVTTISHKKFYNAISQTIYAKLFILFLSTDFSKKKGVQLDANYMELDSYKAYIKEADELFNEIQFLN